MNSNAFVVALALSCSLFDQPEQAPQSKLLVFTHVTVIDTTGAPARGANPGLVAINERCSGVDDLGQTRTAPTPRTLVISDPVDHIDVPAREPMVIEHPDGTLFVSGYGTPGPKLWKSPDRGATWSRVKVGTEADGAIGNSDVDLAVGPDGTLYFVTMGYDRKVNEGTHVSIGVSKDVGTTWSWKMLSKSRFDDQPWVKAAPDGTAHVIWNDGRGVRHAVSKDGGLTWTERVRIHSQGGSSHLTVGPLGEVAVRVTPSSASGNKFDKGVDLVAVSSDAGTTWQKYAAPGDREWSSTNDTETLPRWVEPLAWDVRGALYSLWTNRTGLWLGRSVDRGRTWKNWRVAESRDVLYFPYLVARGPGELAATWFSGRSEVLQAHVARIDVSGGDAPPRIIEAPPFRPDSWRPGARPQDPPIRDTAGEYLAVTFLHTGGLAVVSPIQNKREQRFGFSFRRVFVQQEQAPQSKPLVFTHVTVIDATGAPAQPDMTVVISGDRILRMEKTGKLPVPENAQVVDATGKFLIPGLWDMHVHISGQDYTMPLFLANGVTGVRDMHDRDAKRTLQMREQVKQGQLLGPRIVAAGALVDGPQPIWPGSLVAANAEEGRAAVHKLKKMGADFVKVYHKLPRDAYMSIADECKKQAMPFAGHVPEAVGAAEASDAGQKSMEHFWGVWTAFSSRETELRKEAVEAITKMDRMAAYQALLRIQVKAIDTYNETKSQALFARFVKNATWQVPTLTVWRAWASMDQESFTNDLRLKYMPGYIKTMWSPAGPASKGGLETIAEKKRLYKESLELVGSMHRAGVSILAGTDMGNPYCFPGFSLHDELELLVKAGLTPMEALQTATRKPAKYLDKLKDVGTVEQGKIADLVLLEADPLKEIKNTQKIAAVVVGGKLLSKEKLQQMLADVEAAASKK